MGRGKEEGRARKREERVGRRETRRRNIEGP